MERFGNSSEEIVVENGGVPILEIEDGEDFTFSVNYWVFHLHIHGSSKKYKRERRTVFFRPHETYVVRAAFR
jgi:hypothetical protein